MTVEMPSGFIFELEQILLAPLIEELIKLFIAIFIIKYARLLIILFAILEFALLKFPIIYSTSNNFIYYVITLPAIIFHINTGILYTKENLNISNLSRFITCYVLHSIFNSIVLITSIPILILILSLFISFSPLFPIFKIKK